MFNRCDKFKKNNGFLIIISIFINKLYWLHIHAKLQSQSDPVTGEKVLIEPNPDKRAREFADKGGGIFGNLGKIGANKSGGVVDFAIIKCFVESNFKNFRFFTSA